MPNSDVSSRNARAWGQDLMTEALHSTLESDFEEVELNRIQAIMDSKNTRSLNLFAGLASKKKEIFGKGANLTDNSETMRFFVTEERMDKILAHLRGGITGRQWLQTPPLTPGMLKLIGARTHYSISLRMSSRI